MPEKKPLFRTARLTTCGVRRVMDGKPGMTFPIDHITLAPVSGGEIAHVRDYRYKDRPISGEQQFVIWTLGVGDWEPLDDLYGVLSNELVINFFDLNGVSLEYFMVPNDPETKKSAAERAKWLRDEIAANVVIEACDSSEQKSPLDRAKTALLNERYPLVTKQIAETITSAELHQLNRIRAALDILDETTTLVFP